MQLIAAARDCHALDYSFRAMFSKDCRDRRCRSAPLHGMALILRWPHIFSFPARVCSPSLQGLFSPCLQSAVFRWITWSGAIGITCLGLLFSAGFAFRRDPEVPWNFGVSIGPIEIPILALYGFAVASCAIQAALQFPIVLANDAQTGSQCQRL